MSGLACHLDALEPDERVRRASLLTDLRGAVTSASERLDGYELTLATGRVSGAALQELIDLEGRCCPFLQFELQDGDGVWRLRIAGSPEVRELIRNEFAPGSADP